MSEKYFERRVDSALKRYTEYTDKHESYRQNIGFIAAGNLKKSVRKRFNAINDKSATLHTEYERRRIFRDTWQLPNNDVAECYRAINPILSKCSTNKHWSDSTDFWKAEYSKDLEEKIEALSTFIKRYGSKMDKKYLLPKLEKLRPEPVEMVATPLVLHTNAATPQEQLYLSL